METKTDSRRLKRVVRPLPETPLQEIDRMRKIMRHYMRLTHVSRLHVKRLATAYEWEDLPEADNNGGEPLR
jgi:hypothetical protein